MERRHVTELARLELLFEQIAAVEKERDTLLAAKKDSVAATLIPAGAMLCDIKGIGLEFATILWTP
jgi:transposase